MFFSSLGLTALCFPDHFYSKNVEHTFDSDIMQYVTHDQCRAANELGLTLSIHMVKRRALSEVNSCSPKVQGQESRRPRRRQTRY